MRFVCQVLVYSLLWQTVLSGAVTKKLEKATSTTQANAGKVDVNSASEADLERLPGVGRSTAAKIISHRPYTKLAELKNAGLSPRKIDAIRESIVVGPAVPGTLAVPEKESIAPTSTSATAISPSAAKTEVPAHGQVWVNLDTGIYHREGTRWYGKTKNGKYISEVDAIAAGYRATKARSKK
jgi:hypothetical protein